MLILYSGFKRIFFGLSINSTVYMDRVRIWIDPFDPVVDKFSMSTNDYPRDLVGNVTQSGIIEITSAGPAVTKYDWDTVINYPTYKLNIDV